MARLGEFVEQIRGVSYKPEDVYDELTEKSVALLRANNIKDGRLNFQDIIYISKDRAKENQYLRAGDILVCTSSGSKDLVGKAAYVEHDLPMVFGAFCKVVRPTAGLPQYFGHFFNSSYYRKKISDASAGANINNIRNEHIDELEIQIPPIPTQKQIIITLNQINNLLALRKQQLDKLDELVKARFVEMFGDLAYKANYVFLESICEMVTVGIANSATHAYSEDGTIMFRNQNIKENYLDDSDLIYIHPKFADKYKTKALKENDILVTRTGYPGVACLVPRKYEGCQTFTTLIVRLKEKSPVDANYVCHFINSSYGKRYVDETKVGVAQQNFGAKVLAKMPIFLPLPEQQQEYQYFTEQTDKCKLTFQQGLDKLEVLKKALMQEYFG